MYDIAIIICGSKLYSNFDLIKQDIYDLPVNSIVFSSDEKGPDSLGLNLASLRGLSVEEIETDWKRFGHAGGMRRNGRLLSKIKQVLAKEKKCLAYLRNESSDFGPLAMCDMCEKNGIEVVKRVMNE